MSDVISPRESDGSGSVVSQTDLTINRSHNSGFPPIDSIDVFSFWLHTTVHEWGGGSCTARCLAADFHGAPFLCPHIYTTSLYQCCLSSTCVCVMSSELFFFLFARTCSVSFAGGSTSSHLNREVTQTKVLLLIKLLWVKINYPSQDLSSCLIPLTPITSCCYVQTCLCNYVFVPDHEKMCLNMHVSMLPVWVHSSTEDSDCASTPMYIWSFFASVWVPLSSVSLLSQSITLPHWLAQCETECLPVCLCLLPPQRLLSVTSDSLRVGKGCGEFIQWDCV